MWLQSSFSPWPWYFFYFISDETSLHFILQLLQNVWSLWFASNVVYSNKHFANAYANQSSSGQPQDKCQPLPRFFKRISHYSASRDLPQQFDIFWKGCSFLCLTDSCLTGCKPANRIGPHGLHLKGRELLKATTQSELRYSCHDGRKWRNETV